MDVGCRVSQGPRLPEGKVEEVADVDDTRFEGGHGGGSATPGGVFPPRGERRAWQILSTSHATVRVVVFNVNDAILLIMHVIQGTELPLGLE